MNSRNSYTQAQFEGEIMAYFGQARLVKYLDGRLELVGGSEEDRKAARKWIGFFLRDAVVHER